MSPMFVLAAKEFRDGLRNKWVTGATLLLAALAFALTFLGSSPAGLVDAKPLAVTVVSISSLTIFLVPLIALLIGYDSIVGESERGCLLLMLTYPVTRGQILLGKFLGHAAILTVATVVGYGAAGLAAAITGSADAASWRAFSALLVSSALLGFAFLALAYLASVIVAERSTAAGVAVGLWLLFVIVYDLALMGLLVASKGGVGADVFPALLLLNPADSYRLFNLTAFENVRQISGMGGGCCDGTIQSECSISRSPGLDHPPTCGCSCSIPTEGGMTALKLLSIVAVSMLCGCGSAEQQVAKPREPDANSVGFFCRMGLTEHVGPKAQILPKGWTDPLWFSSVRDALTYAETEVVSEREMAGFWVNDMEQGTWEKPAPGAWVAAQEAWYVIESRMASGMGGGEAVPFKDKRRAQVFANENGGQIVDYEEAKRSIASGVSAESAGET